MFPTEIVDHILSILHSAHDYISLEKCSVVFPEIAHRHLYSSVTTLERSTFPLDASLEFLLKRLERLEPARNDYYVVRKLSDTLLQQPHIRSFIRAIRIVIWDVADGLHYSEVPDRTISFLITGLPQLESISLAALSPWNHLEWAFFSPGFRASFRNVVISPTIKQVELLQIDNFSVKTFEDCDNLKDLFILGKVADGDCVSTSLYPKLSSLHISGYSARVDSWLLRSNTLHTLTLPFHDPESLLSVWKLIEACSKTLVNLTLHNNTYSRFRQSHNLDQFHQLHPIQFHHLNQLNLCISIVCIARRAPVTCFPHLTSFISTLIPSPGVSSIQLCIKLEIWDHRSDQTERKHVDWSIFVPLVLLSPFRHPIRVYTTTHLPSNFTLSESFGVHPAIKSYIEDGKLRVLSLPRLNY